MFNFRFSVTALLIAVFCASFFFASLRSESAIWANTVTTLALGVLLFAAARATFGQREHRPYWGTFALFGWAYLTLVFGPWFREAVANRLVTSTLLDKAYVLVSHSVPPPQQEGAGVIWVRSDGSVWIDGQPAASDDELRARLQDASRAPRPYALHLEGRPSNTMTIKAVSVEKAAKATRVSINWGNSTAVVPLSEHFHQFGHAALSLVVALVGGGLSRLFGPRDNTATKPANAERRTD